MKTIEDIPGFIKDFVTETEGVWPHESNARTFYERGVPVIVTKSQYETARRILSVEPDDSKAPEWAKWKAQDADGWWNWFEVEPYHDHTEWLSRDGWHVCHNEGQVLGDWRKTLKRVHRNTGSNEMNETPVTPEEDAAWDYAERRMDVIGSNGNDGDHYDPVNHPAHYTQGGIECIDAIQASMTPDEFAGFLKGNTQKYIWRYKSKGGAQDLAKARWYLERLEKHVAGQ